MFTHFGHSEVNSGPQSCRKCKIKYLSNSGADCGIFWDVYNLSSSSCSALCAELKIRTKFYFHGLLVLKLAHRFHGRLAILNLQ